MSKLSKRISFFATVFFSAATYTAVIYSQKKPDMQQQVYQEVKELINALGISETKKKIEIIDRIGKLRPAYAVPALTQLLDEKRVEVRIATVKSLGKIATAQSVKSLLKAIKDKEVSVKKEATNALSSMFIDEAYQACIKILQTVPELKNEALECLRKWNQPHAKPPEPARLPGGKVAPKIPKQGKEAKKKPKQEKVKKPSETKMIGAEKPEEIKQAAETPEDQKAKEVAVKEGKKPPTAPYEKKLPEIKGKELESPYEEATLVLQRIKQVLLKCLLMYDKDELPLRIKILVTPGGRLAHLYLLRKTPQEAENCLRASIRGLEFPPHQAAYTIDYILPGGRNIKEMPPEKTELISEEEIFPLKAKEEEKTGTSFVPSELTFPLRHSTTVLTFAVPFPGGSFAFGLAGEVTIKKIFSIGAEISGGTTALEEDGDDDQTSSSEISQFGNIALTFRATGKSQLKKMDIFYGFKLLLLPPTSKNGNYKYINDSTVRASRKLSAYSVISKINYYRVEKNYPNINHASLVFIRPDFFFAGGNNLYGFEFEIGLNFLIMGTASYKYELPTGQTVEEETDMPNIILIHGGGGLFFNPLKFLQLSFEITMIKELAGKTYKFPDLPSDITSPGGEIFLTPATTIFAHIGKTRLYLQMGMRVCAGTLYREVGNLIWLASTGFIY